METLVSMLWSWCVTILDHLVPGLVILFCLPRLSRHLTNNQNSYYGPGAFLLLFLLWILWRQNQQLLFARTEPKKLPDHERLCR